MNTTPPDMPVRDLFEASLVNLIRTYLLAGASRREILEVMELRFTLMAKATDHKMLQDR